MQIKIPLDLAEAITKLHDKLKMRFGCDFSYTIMGCGHLIAANNLKDGITTPKLIVEEKHSIVRFAERIIGENADIKACYIAIVLVDGKYDIEVEVKPKAEIVATYRGVRTFNYAKALRGKLTVAMKKAGVKVYDDRERWALFSPF